MRERRKKLSGSVTGTTWRAKAKGKLVPGRIPGSASSAAHKVSQTGGRERATLWRNEIEMSDVQDTETTLPGTDCETLVGWDQIGRWQGISAETARARAKRYDLPIAKPLGWNKPIAIKTELNAALVEIARKAMKN
jgi:hypothetical protein